MKLEVWVESFGIDYPAWQPTLDRELPISALNIATIDSVPYGPVWRGAGEAQDRRAITGPVALRQWAENCRELGIEPRIHTIPHGLDPVREAELAIVAMSVVPDMVVNFESAYWTAPLANVSPYMQAIRAAHPTARIGVTVHPFHVDQVAAWSPFADVFYPMLWWGPMAPGGGVDPIPHLNSLADSARNNCPDKPITVLIEGDDPDPIRFTNGYKYALSLGMEVAVWRRGITTRWGEIAALP